MALTEHIKANHGYDARARQDAAGRELRGLTYRAGLPVQPIRGKRTVS